MAVLELSSFEMMNSHKNALGSYQFLLAFGVESELSIISGEGAYGIKNAPYEIAVSKHGELQVMPGITNEDDSVKGYLTEDDVSTIIKKMYFLTGKTPSQV